MVFDQSAQTNLKKKGHVVPLFYSNDLFCVIFIVNTSYDHFNA